MNPKISSFTFEILPGCAGNISLGDPINRKSQIMRSEQLEKRLVKFSVAMIKLTNGLPRNRLGQYLQDQLSRSSISVTLNYGEAESAESRKDLVHKLKVALKELRETMLGLKILSEGQLVEMDQHFEHCLKECDELISIFITSINTAQFGKK